MIYPKYVIPAIEDSLSRETLEGQRVATAAQRQERASARFSIEEYLHYADLAAMQIVARVKAVHCAKLQEERQPSNNEWDLEDVHRLIGRGQTYDGTIAARHTHTQYDEQVDRGAGATDDFPAYIWESAFLEIHSSNAVNGSKARSTVVQSPRRARHHDPDGSLSGTTLTVNSDSQYGDADWGLFEEHEQTVAYLHDGSDYYAAHVKSVSNDHTATVDTTAPDGSYEVVWYTHAFVPMEETLESALVEYATMLCLASEGEERFEAAMENFQEAIAPYRMPMFNYRQLDE